MKNTTIRNAWDTVTPTAAQKRRMRSALEAQLTSASQVSGAGRKETKGEEGDMTTMDFAIPQSGQNTEKAEKTGKPRPKYQASQPQKPRGSALAMIAAMLAVVVAGGLFLGVMKGNLEGKHDYALPPEALTAPATEATQAPETAQLPAAYQERIQTYVTAIQEGWNIEQCANGEISLVTSNVASLDDLGYALMDLDGDGSEELLITDGNVIYSMYSLSPEGEAVCWITGMERDAYYLSAENLIAEVGSGSAATTYFTFYRFTNNTLDKTVEVTFDADKDRENPWFLGDAMEPITEAEANQILNMYFHLYISHTTLSGEAPLPEETPTDETVLKLYAQEVSVSLAEYARTESLTFCFCDYDGDGESECLLGAGKAVYAVLSVEGNHCEVTSYGGDSGISYLCEDGVMEMTGYGEEYRYFAFYKVQGNEKLDHVLYDDQSWYTKADGEDPVPVSEEAANAVLGKYKRLNLPWKDIAEFPVAIPQITERTGMDLFEDVFVPIAASGKKVTEDELKAKMEENGYQWNIGEGQIYCYASDTCYAWLSADLASENGGLGDELTFQLPGEDDRWVWVKWEGEEAQYFKRYGSVGSGVRAATIDELRNFLNTDAEVISLCKTAEAFAYAYFQRDQNIMLEYTTQTQISFGDMFTGNRNTQIEKLTGWENANFTGDSETTVSAAFYFDSEDSLTYLTMEMVKENDQWKVSSWFLEK